MCGKIVKKEYFTFVRLENVKKKKKKKNHSVVPDYDGTAISPFFLYVILEPPFHIPFYFLHWWYFCLIFDFISYIGTSDSSFILLHWWYLRLIYHL